MVALKQQLTPSPRRATHDVWSPPGAPARSGDCSQVSHLFDVGIKTKRSNNIYR